MPKKKKTQKPHIPLAVDGIQTNFCKNPLCSNFGRPPSLTPPPLDRPKADTHIDTYVKSSQGKDLPGFKCKKCGEHFILKSNQAIAEELKRISANLEKPQLQLNCPDENCENSSFSVMSSPGKYKPFGVTTANNPRFRCRKCGKSFTIKERRDPIARQRKYSHLNKQIFLDIVNKMPFRGISSKYGISMETVYNKLDFFYRQCVAFSSNRERGLVNQEFDELYISVDRQDYRLNWTSKGDRRNMVVTGVTCAEKFSGYIFAEHLNYDSRVDKEQIIQEANQDTTRNDPPSFRKHARFWLPHEVPLNPKKKQKEVPESKSIITDIKRKYEETVVRPDVDVPQEKMDLRKKVKQGLLIHSEYTLYAHFEYLKKLLAGTKKIIFYMDQESGIRAACFSAFHQDILDKRVDAFYVTLDKKLTVDQKLNLVTKNEYSFEEFLFEHPEYEEAKEFGQKSLYMESLLKRRVKVGPWDDEWLVHPFPFMGEPKKAVCWLTDIGDRAYTEFELGILFLRASLFPVDRYFAQLRRKTSLLERPISTQSSGGRKWFAYDPYQPITVEKMTEIYRVFYNYVKIGKYNMTPAMRLGLAKGPVKLEKILYFTESTKDLFSRR